MHWSDARRILCVRLDNMGDVLMTTPALRALRESAPERSITLLCSRSGAAIARHVPEVDAIIPYDAPWMKLARPTLPSADLAMRSTLESRRFDAAVIFTAYSQSALPAATLCHLAGIPLRLAHCRENPYHLLTTWVAETEPHQELRHEVRRQLDLVAAVGAHTADERLSLRVTAEERLSATLRLTEGGIDVDRPWLIVHPGATAASRRYPADKFARAAGELAATLDCQVAVTGDASERDLASAIARLAGPRARSLAGVMDLSEFSAAISLAPLLVANNTGAVHIAAAVGTPVVDLYALTNPQHTPWQVASRVLSKDVPCKYCYKSTCPQGHHRCLEGIEVDDVVAAARELWTGGERFRAAA